MKDMWIGAIAIALAAVVISSRVVQAGVIYNAIDLTPAGVTSAEAHAVTSVGVVGFTTDSLSNALSAVWNGSPPAISRFADGSYSSTHMVGAFGTQMVGYGDGVGAATHGLLWNGTSSSATDIQPASLENQSFGSFAMAINGSIVGFQMSPSDGSTKAILWTNTNQGSAAIKLMTIAGGGIPSGFTNSQALAVTGTHAVGFANNPNTGIDQAVLWSWTSPTSAITPLDLTPSSFSSARALGIAAIGSGFAEVGYGIPTGSSAHNALLWTGSATLFTNLNPTGYSSSDANAILGTQVVGQGVGPLSSQNHALLWDTTNPSVPTDLQTFLPASDVSSDALGLDANGDIVGTAVDSNGMTRAIEWVPTLAVPEPGSFSLIAGAVILLARRKQCR